MKFIKKLLPMLFIFVAFFIAGAEFAALVHPVTCGPAWWKLLASITIGAAVFFAYFGEER